MTRLVCYGSQQAHSSVERAGLLAGVRMRLLDTDQDLAITGDILEAAVTEDRARGLIPFCCVATLGTTSSCAFDDLKTLGPVCQKEVKSLENTNNHCIMTFRACGFILTRRTRAAPSSVRSSGRCWTG